MNSGEIAVTRTCQGSLYHEDGIRTASVGCIWFQQEEKKNGHFEFYHMEVRTWRGKVKEKENPF